MFVTLRLAIVVLLKTTWQNFGVHFGLKCSSMCKVNVGTSGRSACSSEGHDNYPSVLLSNMLLERILGQENPFHCFCGYIHDAKHML